MFIHAVRIITSRTLYRRLTYFVLLFAYSNVYLSFLRVNDISFAPHTTVWEVGPGWLTLHTLCLSPCIVWVAECPWPWRHLKMHMRSSIWELLNFKCANNIFLKYTFLSVLITGYTQSLWLGYECLIHLRWNNWGNTVPGDRIVSPIILQRLRTRSHDVPAGRDISSNLLMNMSS